MKIVMDGTTYNLRVQYETIGRSFRLEDGENAGKMISGLYERDLVGTYYDYSMTVEPEPGSEADYDAFYEVISAPVSSHSITMPYGQGTMTFDAMVYEGTDLYRGMVAGQRKWAGLQVTFSAKGPQRTPQ